MKNYPIVVFWSDEDNAYIAVVPDLPGLSAGGDTEATAIEEIHVAIDLWIEAATEVGNPIPEPSQPEFINKTAGNAKTIFAKLNEKIKKKRIRCPLCGWQPDGKPYWGCEKCGVTFDTFKTHAHCPNSRCGNSWTFTQCIACHANTPHEDWYEKEI